MLGCWGIFALMFFFFFFFGGGGGLDLVEHLPHKSFRGSFVLRAFGGCEVPSIETYKAYILHAHMPP